MSDETLEEKLARYETFIDLQMKEIDRLRSDLARATEGAGALATLQALYRNGDLPESLRAKCAGLALAHESPALKPQEAPLNLVAEEIIEPLATVVERQRKRADALQAEGRNIEVTASGVVQVLPKPSSNGSGGDSNCD